MNSLQWHRGVRGGVERPASAGLSPLVMARWLGQPGFMTTIEARRAPRQSHPDLSGTSRLSATSRLTVVGIGDVEGDGSAVAWAMQAARGADVVHLVHAYIPIDIPGCSWAPVVARRDARRTVARLSMSKALQRIRAGHYPTATDGSVVAGLPADVLVEFSAVADLLIVCEDGPADAISPRHRTVTEQVAHSAMCPVVIVSPTFDPSAGRADAPVTLLLRGAEIPTRAIEFAYSEAVRMGASLCIAQAWPAEHETTPVTAEIIAGRQQRLDAQLAHFERRDPLVGVFSELLQEDYAHSANELRLSSRVLVVGSTPARMPGLTGPSSPGCCPVIVIPDVALHAGLSGR